VYCLLPILFILNTDGSLIKMLQCYKRPDPHAIMANEACARNLGTHATKVYIKPNGHMHVVCERKLNEQID